VAEGATVKKGDLLFVFDKSDLKSEEESILGEIGVVDSQIKNQITSFEMQRNALESDKAAVRIQLEKAQMEAEKLSEDLETTKILYEFGDLAAQDLNNGQFSYEQAVKNRELAAAQLKYLETQISMVNTQANDLRAGQNSATEKEESRRQQLLAQKDALGAQLDLLQQKQSEIEIFAAQDGVIREMSLKAGQIITPGSRLCCVYQPDEYRVDCYILVENIQGVKIGDEVEVTLQLRDGDKIFKGNIVQLAHDAVERVSKVGLSEKRIKVEINVEEEGWENLGPYWPVEICFVTAQALNCLIAPKTALFEDGNNAWKVWAVRGGKTVAVPVERGIQTPSQVEIKGQISSGDIIVRNAKASGVSEGQSIRSVNLK
jgi:multidrug resistance efflux pump